ncbi:Crp/Fnr family transcriptional regulator [Variovorax sp. J22R133]|uniref:Crp/Fnr family transcriptional regulator n=1 Tax=Variovorax brevis TaxID=3053503 RepID=UPI002575FE87|nr:Crp/Fnr family transcriptional regulator [Variovorax sp. J22R133]MDM0116452.1 Crp/Fnr family transcriptional regulator [Variovorax sp. J22R133]
MYLHPLIASVPAAERAEFIRFVKLRSYRRNAVVLGVDEWTDCIYCVANGLVRVVMQRNTDSEGVTTDFIGQDRFFLSPNLQRDRYQPGATLIAALPSSVYLVPVPKLRTLCAKYPEVAIGLLELAVKRIATLRGQLRRISAAPSERLWRILHELTQLAPVGAGGFDKRITQSVIASYSGLSREQVNKTMRELEDRGLVSRDAHSIHVPSHFASTAFEEPLSIDEVSTSVDAQLGDSALFTESFDDLGESATWAQDK